MAETAREDKPVVYISGPVTGYEEWNFPAFHRAADRLREHGFAVVNPAENIGGEADMTAEWFLGLDIMMIVTRCDYIVMLPGWRDSRGAKIELLAAHGVGLPAYRYREEGVPVGPRINVLDYSVDVGIRPRQLELVCDRQEWDPHMREVV